MTCRNGCLSSTKVNFLAFFNLKFTVVMSYALNNSSFYFLTFYKF